MTLDQGARQARWLLVPAAMVIGRAVWVGTPPGFLVADVVWNLVIGVVLLLGCVEVGLVLLWGAARAMPVHRTYARVSAQLLMAGVLLFINVVIYLDALQQCGPGRR